MHIAQLADALHWAPAITCGVLIHQVGVLGAPSPPEVLDLRAGAHASGDLNLNLNLNLKFASDHQSQQPLDEHVYT